ncbi:hypothetical protein R0K05_17750, partial [Planococcus sp. SIMBA_160]
GVSGGYGKNGSGAQGEHAAAQGSPDGKPGGATGGKSVGFGTTSDSQKSVTHSGINTRNVQITNAAGQAATGRNVDEILAAAFTETTTETAEQTGGALVNRFDPRKIQKELDTQMEITQGFDDNRQQFKAELYQNL